MVDGIRGTSPSIILTVPSTIDLTKARDVYATFQQGRVKITKNSIESDISIPEKNKVVVYLTQEETLRFNSAYGIDVQLNWVYPDGKRNATLIATIKFGGNLLEEVL